MNKVVLVGRITQNPELKQTNNGVSYVQFNIAINRPSKEKVTDFIPCVIYQQQAENLARYVVKGRLIGVEGRIQVDKFEKEGQSRNTITIVCSNVHFLESGKSQETHEIKQSSHNTNEKVFEEVSDDDVDPF